MHSLARRIWKDDSGQDLVEYVLIMIIIALGVTAAMTFFKDEVASAYDKSGSAIQSGVDQSSGG